MGQSGDKVEVSGSVFTGPMREGDFTWMIEQPEHSRTLFVFNDNEEQFLAFMSGDRTIACVRGGGNASVRPYQCHQPFPRAAGIPTGSNGQGYQELDDRVRHIVDEAISRINDLIRSGNYEKIVFSKDPDLPTLGTGIFNPSNDVKAYVYTSLMKLNEITTD